MNGLGVGGGYNISTKNVFTIGGGVMGQIIMLVTHSILVQNRHQTTSDTKSE